MKAPLDFDVMWKPHSKQTLPMWLEKQEAVKVLILTLLHHFPILFETPGHTHAVKVMGEWQASGLG